MRSIVHELRFERELRTLFPSPKEADAFVESAVLVLAFQPEIGSPVSPDSPVWGLPMALIRGRQFTLFYTFDTETVWLLSIAAV